MEKGVISNDSAAASSVAPQGGSRATAAATAQTSLPSLIPQITGCLAVGLAVAYFVGWIKVGGYLNTIGAPWAGSMFSSTQLLQESGLLVPAMLFAAFVSSRLVGSGVINAFWITTAGALIVLSTSALAIAFLWSKPAVQVMLLQAAIRLALICIYSIGIWSAAYIGALLSGPSSIATRGFRVIDIIASILILLLAYSPYTLGRLTALRDLNPETSMLATVLTKDEPNGPRWLLVAAVDRQMLVMQPTSDKNVRRFRLVTGDEIYAIHAGRR